MFVRIETNFHPCQLQNVVGSSDIMHHRFISQLMPGSLLNDVAKYVILSSSQSPNSHCARNWWSAPLQNSWFILRYAILFLYFGCGLPHAKHATGSVEIMTVKN